MEVQLENPVAEIKRLQRCMNDLVGLLALPVLWSGGEPAQIARTLLDVLPAMLRLDLLYLRVKDAVGQTPVEMARVLRSAKLKAWPQEIGEALNHCLGEDSQKWPGLIRSSIGNGHISIVTLHLGLEGDIGVLVAGSDRADFPGQTEKLLLSVAANQAAIGLQEARLLSEQKRLSRELDQRVAQRTSEVAAANEELKKEVIERKRAEEALRANERDLNHIINTIPVLAWCNLPDGSNEFLNQPWHDYTGLSPEEAHGWGWQVTIHPDDLPKLLDKWWELLAAGEPGEIEARLRRFDGVYRWFLFRVNPLRDESGSIVKWYGTNTDIDDRKRAEEELRRHEAFLAEGQRLSLTGSFSWRVGTDEITWSEQLYRIFEVEPAMRVTLELIGTRVHPEDIRLLNDMVERARGAASDFAYEHRLQMPDHSVKYVHLVAHATRDKEGRLEYIGAVQDVTQRRISEEALGKARSELAHVARVTSLSALTASIAHEVNQPLSGIITNASTCLRMLAADPPNVDGARETARRTLRDGNRASDVVSRLRALFSKKAATTDSVDLNEATREVVALSLSELQRSRVILQPELAEDLPPVTGDRVQLQQVVLNLLLNAADAMKGVDDRPRQLVIRTERHEGDRVRLSVRDAGVGFEAQGMDKLFEPFYTTKSEGMGIGLSVSRSIVENHHGRLWAAPNDGPGATFSFSIPRAPEV
jgi:PAS domain S-box-containing protein